MDFWKATTDYWQTNPVLYIVAEFAAFAGTAGEGTVASKTRKQARLG